MARKSYLPTPGDVYWVEAVVFYDYDPKPRRPVLVIGVLRPTSEGIAVVTRTTDLASNGVYSAADPSLGLNKPGVWVYKKYARVVSVDVPAGQTAWCCQCCRVGGGQSEVQSMTLPKKKRI